MRLIETRETFVWETLEISLLQKREYIFVYNSIRIEREKPGVFIRKFARSEEREREKGEGARQE